MIERLADVWDAFADRFRVVISVVGAAWMVLVTADYAGFVDLPQILPFKGIWPLIAGGAFNAVWWGALYPRVIARRKSREELKKSNKGSLANG